jgi:hypothetical protein
LYDLCCSSIARVGSSNRRPIAGLNPQERRLAVAISCGSPLTGPLGWSLGLSPIFLFSFVMWHGLENGVSRRFHFSLVEFDESNKSMLTGRIATRIKPNPFHQRWISKKLEDDMTRSVFLFLEKKKLPCSQIYSKTSFHYHTTYIQVVTSRSQHNIPASVLSLSVECHKLWKPYIRRSRHILGRHTVACSHLRPPGLCQSGRVGPNNSARTSSRKILTLLAEEESATRLLSAKLETYRRPSARGELKRDIATDESM